MALNKINIGLIIDAIRRNEVYFIIFILSNLYIIKRQREQIRKVKVTSKGKSDIIWSLIGKK